MWGSALSKLLAEIGFWTVSIREFQSMSVLYAVLSIADMISRPAGQMPRHILPHFFLSFKHYMSLCKVP